jgi:hypothetical protein
MNLANPREFVHYIKNLYSENISKEAAATLKIIRAGGMPKKDTEIPKTLLREAGSYAYQYVKPRRFLTEIDNEEFSELRLFDKWNPSDPDSFELVMPNNKTINLLVKPIDVIRVNHKKNIAIRTQGNSFLFNILSANSFSCFNEIKNAVRELIVAYIKTKLDVDHSFGQQERFIVVEANKVIGGKYKHGFPVLKKILGGKIWKRLNSEAAKLTVKICGYKASSLEYSIIANNLLEVKDTLEKAPGALVLWIHLCQQKIWKQLGIKNIIQDQDIYSVANSDYSEANFNFPDIIKSTKEWLNPKPSTWKYLIRQNPNRIRRILPHVRNIIDFNHVLDAYSQIGVEPRYTLLKKATAECFTRDCANTTMPALRAAFKASTKSKKIRSFWDSEVSLVLDWIRRERPQFDSNQQKAPWTWFMRQQKDWHERMQLLNRETLKKKYWESLLSTFEYEGYTIIPLTSSLMLFDEGKDMKHCVASYSDDCKFNKCRIFSIVKDNKKLATCEIRPNRRNRYMADNDEDENFGFIDLSNNTWDDTWIVRQVRGPCNDTVDDKITMVAEKIAKEYTRAVELEQKLKKAV